MGVPLTDRLLPGCGGLELECGQAAGTGSELEVQLQLQSGTPKGWPPKNRVSHYIGNMLKHAHQCLYSKNKFKVWLPKGPPQGNMLKYRRCRVNAGETCSPDIQVKLGNTYFSLGTKNCSVLHVEVCWGLRFICVGMAKCVRPTALLVNEKRDALRDLNHVSLHKKAFVTLYNRETTGNVKQIEVFDWLGDSRSS